MEKDFKIILSDILQLTSQNQWFFEIILILIISFSASKIFSNFIKRLHKKLVRARYFWSTIFVKSIETPIANFIPLISLIFILDILYKKFSIEILSHNSIIKKFLIITTLTLCISNFIKKAQKSFIQKITDQENSNTKLDRATIDGVATVSLILVYITGALLLLQVFGFNITGILALGGVGGIAVGFASKDLLSNFFGGLMIYFDRPFQVGDWIKSPDKNIEGTVIKIGWRQTEVRNFDRRPIYIPNSIFATIIVENPSRMTNRRILETIGVRYEDVKKLEKIVFEIQQYLKNHEEIDTNETIIVNVNKFSSSSIDFLVSAFTKTIDFVEYNKIKQQILLKISDIIEENKAEIAFPTSTIHLNKTN